MTRTGTRTGRPVVRWQILSKNPDAHASFYCELFDWQVDASNALGYRELRTGAEQGIDGGVWPAPPEAHAFVQLFVEVDDVPKAVERARGLGAQVIVAPQVTFGCGLPNALTIHEGAQPSPSSTSSGRVPARLLMSMPLMIG